MKRVVLMVIPALICGVIFTSFGSNKVEPKEVELGAEKTIVIDAGHGGRDVGVVFDGKNESEIVKIIAGKIKQQNEQNRVKIILLRESDEFVSLQDRATKVNEIKPDLFISLHISSSKDANINGINAFVSKENSFYHQSKDIAQSLLEAVSSENLMKGKVSEANFMLLKEVKYPSVLLELGFLSNTKDRNFILSETGQIEIATKILEAIE
jgi:N-acetylmuramoyl-L-alanine amidase